METPYYLIDEKELNKNILSFKDALELYWPNSKIAYSIKTNSLPWVLKYMKDINVLAEAVSDEEYDLAIKCGYKYNDIIFNGPIKTKEKLEYAFKNSSVINIDSKKELDFIENHKPDHNGNLGIRININPDVFDVDDIGYIEDGFRFGFSDDSGDLKRAIDLIASTYGNSSFGLHLHCNSVTRSLNVYRSIAKYVSKIITKYDLKPSYIDIGGGFFGGVVGKPTAEEYIKTIRDELENVVDINQTKLIIEPGSAIIASAVDLYTSVIDTKKTKYTNIITTDGSRIHVDPLWKKRNYMYTIESTSKNICLNKQIICGYTCMDHDRIIEIVNQPKLSVGDKIIYHKVGAYTVTFGGPFIRYFPDVYVKTNSSIKKVRKRFNVDKYFEIQYLMEE